MGRVEARRIIAGERAYAVIAGQDDAREGSMKSYAMALDLRDDAEVIERYKEYHRAVWDEVLEGLRSLRHIEDEDIPAWQQAVHVP